MALMPFLMAGDPDLSATAEVLLSLQANGADIVELGIPYTDPLADGPVIQAAAFRALAQKTTPAKVIEMLADLKDQLSMPVILFTYTNPLLIRGPERFFAEAAAAGAAGGDVGADAAQVRAARRAAGHGHRRADGVAVRDLERRRPARAPGGRGLTWRSAA